MVVPRCNVFQVLSNLNVLTAHRRRTGVGQANSAYRVIELVIMKAGAFATEICELTYFEPKLFLNYGEK